MPQFLIDKLKREYPGNPHAVYGTLNRIGAMKGNKETPKGLAMEAKHSAALPKVRRDEFGEYPSLDEYGDPIDPSKVPPPPPPQMRPMDQPPVEQGPPVPVQQQGPPPPPPVRQGPPPMQMPQGPPPPSPMLAQEPPPVPPQRTQQMGGPPMPNVPPSPQRPTPPPPPAPPPQPLTDRAQAMAQQFQQRKNPGIGRQIAGAALSIAPRLRGVGALVSGDAARQREMENLAEAQQAASGEQSVINHRSNEALKLKQMELTDEQKRESLLQQANLKKAPQTLQQKVDEAIAAGYSPEEAKLIGAGWKPPVEKPTPLHNVPPGNVALGADNRPVYTNPLAPEKATGDFEKVFLPAYAKSLGKTVDQLSPEETMKAFGEHKRASADPEMRESALASRALADSMRQLQISQQPTRESAANVAADIIAHRIAPEQLSSMFGGFGQAGQSYKRMVYEEGKKLDPNFNYEQAAAEYGLVKSPSFQNTIRYLDSTRSSIPEVIKTATALANGKIKLVNSVENIGRAQTNNIDLAKFNTARLLVADEIGKILAGGGTGNVTSDGKLNQAMSLIKETDDPALVAASLGEVDKLLGYRRGSLTKGTYLEKADEQSHLGASSPAAPSSRKRAQDAKGNVIEWDGKAWVPVAKQ